mmetsp:Transcript_79369/g.184176  ORF Transcript_79369/g.184176 Transcript_79369/m.184176 type:complete len:245 (-) Transcript_79369:3-737(-)
MAALPSSVAYRTRHALEFHEKLEDGFVDGGRRSGRELLRVSVSEDQRLATFMQFIDQRRRALAVDAVTKVKIVALAIADAFGGSGPEVTNATELRCKQLRERNPAGTVNIGDLMGGRALGETVPGTGICRHRAILFKAVCDQLGICPAMLVRGTYDGGEHVWNFANIGKSKYLVDLMHFKVEPYEEAGAMAQRYVWLGSSGLSVSEPPGASGLGHGAAAGVDGEAVHLKELSEAADAGAVRERN